MEQADFIIIGSGQGGVPLAIDLAGEGNRVVLFEKAALGGTCVNYGCRPSKAFLASAHHAACDPGSDELGVRIEADVDFPRVMERVRGIIDGSREGTAGRLEQAGVRVIKGEASFTGERTVSGGGATLQAGAVIISTGNGPFVPPIEGLAGTPYMTYIDFWQMRELPPRIIIVGGGYVGVELGQGMARLGSETHIVERGKRIISREERDVSETIQAALADDGVVLHLEEEVKAVAHDGTVFTLTLGAGGRIEGEALLMAVGQKPNTASLAADAAGIELDERGFIRVDDRFQTTAAGVYAIGDVTGQPAFTHVAWEDYRRLKSILAGGDRRQGDRVHGYAFFSEPQVGRVGLTLEEAKKQGYRARAETIPLEWVALAYLSDTTRGFYRMVIDEDTDRILGATLVGPAAGELVHVLLAHMEAGSTWQLLEQSVHIHPTLAEGLPTLARQFVR